MPKDLNSLFLYAVDMSGIDPSTVTHTAGGLRDAGGRLVRHARPITGELLKQSSRARPAGPQAAAAVGIAVAGITVGIVASENREVIGRKARDAWRRVRGVSPTLEADDERSYDPWASKRPDDTDGSSAADTRNSQASAKDDPSQRSRGE